MGGHFERPEREPDEPLDAYRERVAAALSDYQHSDEYLAPPAPKPVPSHPEESGWRFVLGSAAVAVLMLVGATVLLVFLAIIGFPPIFFGY